MLSAQWVSWGYGMSTLTAHPSLCAWWGQDMGLQPVDWQTTLGGCPHCHCGQMVLS